MAPMTGIGLQRNIKSHYRAIGSLLSRPAMREVVQAMLNSVSSRGTCGGRKAPNRSAHDRTTDLGVMKPDTAASVAMNGPLGTRSRGRVSSWHAQWRATGAFDPALSASWSGP
jgi:hypothetical protein